MDNNSINTNTKTKEQKIEDYHRVLISGSVEKALGAVVERLNEGFDGGKISRTQATNWILQKFYDNLTDIDIREIRAEHFDEVSVLEAVLIRAKKSGQVPPELKAFLQKQLGLDDTPKKKKKSLQDNVTIDYIESERT